MEVANLRDAGGRGPVTPLAWDVARAVGEVLRFEGEVVVEWEPTYGYGYDHSYCLVFSAPVASAEDRAGDMRAPGSNGSADER